MCDDELGAGHEAPRKQPARARWRPDESLTKAHTNGLERHLANTGLLAEITAVRCLTRANWKAELGPYFLDQSATGERVMREYDLAAICPAYSEWGGGPALSTTLALSIEVKTSRSSPWVLVRPPEHSIAPKWTTPAIAACSDPRDHWPFHDLGSDWSTKLVMACPATGFRRADWIAARLIEPYKDSSKARGRDDGQPFAATMTAVKAGLHLAQQLNYQGLADAHRRGPDQRSATRLFVVRPVVVFDGQLLGMWVRSDDSVDWSVLDVGTCEVELVAPNTSPQRYAVDIVTLSALERYAAWSESCQRGCHNWFYRKLEKAIAERAERDGST